MEEAKEIELIKGIIPKIVNKVIGVVVTLFIYAVIGLTVFYFNTNYVTAQNQTDIKEVKVDIKSIKKDVSNVKNVPTLNMQKIKSIEKDVSRIEKNQSEMRKDIQRMLELLYQIKRNQN